MNLSSGFLRIPSRGGGGLLPILQSLFNDLLGCELLGTDFAARAFGARRLPAAPKLCSTHSRSQPACEGRASWRSSPYFPKTSPRTKRMRMTPQAASQMDSGTFPLRALALSTAPWPLQLAALVQPSWGRTHRVESGKQSPANILHGIRCWLGLCRHTTMMEITSHLTRRTFSTLRTWPASCSSETAAAALPFAKSEILYIRSGYAPHFPALNCDAQASLVGNLLCTNCCLLGLRPGQRCMRDRG